MTGGIQVLAIVGVLYLLLVTFRCYLQWKIPDWAKEKDTAVGIAQTTGNCQVQADIAQVWTNRAGRMAVIADGMGTANTGVVCAQIAADTILDRFEPYQELKEPAYFFKTAFWEANARIQRTIGERRGGAGVGAVFLDHSHLHYGLAGDIRIAILRGEEIIPLSKGRTVWNYLGQDGFREIEICEQPVLLKPGDRVLLASKGIFQELSWRELEDILLEGVSAQETAERIISAVEQKDNPQKDNGSIILIQKVED